jgi:hypothetical protein
MPNGGYGWEETIATIEFKKSLIAAAMLFIAFFSSFCPKYYACPLVAEKPLLIA